VKYDRRDPTRAEMLLVRAGHYLWAQIRKNGTTVREQMIFHEALETIWQAKREVKAEIARKSKEAFAKRKEFICG
jgi:hypothetical protein